MQSASSRIRRNRLIRIEGPELSSSGFFLAFRGKILRKTTDFLGFFRLRRSQSLALSRNHIKSSAIALRRFELRAKRAARLRFRGNDASIEGRGAPGRIIKAASFGAPQTQEFQMTNKAELIDVVAEATESSKAAAGDALDAVIDAISQALKKGEEVRLVGFGTFSVKERAAGKGRNPATGEEIKIPASKSVRFKPGAQLKTLVNK
jgi:DNA-binding protein HU-beta